MVSNKETILELFQKLSRDHNDRLHVMWTMSHNICGIEGFVFHSFSRYGKQKGNGAIALSEVLDLADQLGIDVSLWTSPPRLFAYYESFGFVNQGPHVWDGRTTFKRTAQQLVKEAA